MKPTFFATPIEWRKWLKNNHGRATELLVGFYKRKSGRPSITWPEAVDQALCFGWIDAVRRGIDAESYSIRFTPRKPGGVWSAINIKRAEELRAQGLMHPTGVKAFEARQEHRSRIYAYEQENVKFEPTQEKLFRANKPAWDFFNSQPAWYRRSATWWTLSAKREETREKRLATLIADSEQGRTLRHLTRRQPSPSADRSGKNG